MYQATPLPLLKPPLYYFHFPFCSKMFTLVSYSMPVQYPSGLMTEHFHTRNSASLFDVSHMGQISLKGPKAAQALET